jgi:uncharacterized protein (DUF302 family)
MERAGLGIHITTVLDFAEAERRTREALAAEGFGILTEIDVAATMRAKLGVEMPPYKILGACNPPLAHQALTIWAGFGVLMPCNVVIQDLGDRRAVTAFDPLGIAEVRDNAGILPIANEVQARLERALATVEQQA